MLGLKLIHVSKRGHWWNNWLHSFQALVHQKDYSVVRGSMNQLNLNWSWFVMFGVGGLKFSWCAYQNISRTLYDATLSDRNNGGFYYAPRMMLCTVLIIVICIHLIINYTPNINIYMGTANLESDINLIIHDDAIKWNFFRVTGPLCGEFTGHQWMWIPLTKASDAELWCFLWSAPEQIVE